jgi:hypothetical protein
MAYIDLDNLRSVLLADDDLRARKLQRQSCGQLKLTSGRIVACDPLVQFDRAAFERTVAARGACAVEVLRERASRPALAVLWLRERAACAADTLRWELALMPGEAMADLGEDDFFGYPVDAGMGCFMDAEAAQAMAERERRGADDPHFNYYDNVMADELGEEDIADHYPLGEGTPNNIVMFASGWGDGSYPSYWALDAAGEPVALVTDFMIMQGGDGRSEEDKRDEAYLASLAPDKLAALEALGAAVSRDDGEAIRDLLAARLAGANEIVPSSGETAIGCALRLNHTNALRLLLADGPCPPLPKEMAWREARTYLEYAGRFTEPRTPALLDLLAPAQARADAEPGGESEPRREPAFAAPLEEAAEKPVRGFWKRLFS